MGDAESDRPGPAPVRVVLDTNVLIGALYNPGSASARIFAACLEGRLCAVVSPALGAEYARIIPRAVRRPGWEGPFARFLDAAVHVEPAEAVHVVAADPSDDALFAAAVAGGAAAVVTNDRPVLQAARGPSAPPGVAALRPSACAAAFLG
jgi:predicted nucleic acid-binding protein